MPFTLVPDYIFDPFDACCVDFLKKIGVSGIVLDIDNTLEPYENPSPGPKVVEWLDSLLANGIKAAIVSNNDLSRVEKFNRSLGLPAYAKGAKPFKKNVLRAIKDMGIDKSSAILMGDQIFTDVWAAKNAGIPAILVSPIRDKRDVFTRFKRLLERPIVKKYYRKRDKI